jgi:hypothetical protein
LKLLRQPVAGPLLQFINQAVQTLR